MTMRRKMIVAGLVMAMALGYLAVAGSKGVYFLSVDQFMENAEARQQRVRLTGTVSAEGLEVNAGLLQAEFVLLGETQQLPVRYRGVVPDLFKAEHEVIVEGKLDESGLFQANVLLTKCASKYDAKEQHPETVSK
jgi:cytochrome c-type biogenesis protein CcmE